MAEKPKLYVLDVGNALCAVVVDRAGVVMIDYPAGATVREFLAYKRISHLEAVLVSHSHEDHCAGLAAHWQGGLTADVIRMNPRRGLRSAAFEDVLDAIERAKGTPNPPRLDYVHHDVVESCFQRGALSIRILHPPATIAYDPRAARVWEDEHKSCGVVRLDVSDEPSALLMGDLSVSGLRVLADWNSDALRAPLLVYPHHGGHPGGDAAKFADELMNLVEPKFSVPPSARPHRAAET